MSKDHLISRSAPIRQMISPTQKRLGSYLNELSSADLKCDIEADVSAEENATSLEEKLYRMKNFVKRISGAIDVLNSKNHEWSQLLQSLSGEELVNENSLYMEYTTRDENFVDLINSGIEASDMLESKMNEVQDTINRLRRGRMDGEASIQPARSVQQAHNEQMLQVQLPKLQLPIYHGDPQKWVEFWDAFNAAVNMQEIPAVQKFSYLLSALKGNAYKAIEGITITNANYSDAIDILKRRFGDVNIIKRSLYGDLRSLPKSSGKIFDLRRTLDGIDRTIRQLKALGEDIDHPNLTMVIMEKLPMEILIELGKMKPQNETWRTEDLSQCLDHLISIKEEAYHFSSTSGISSSTGDMRPNFRPDRSKQGHQLSSSEKFTDTFTNVVPTSQGNNRIREHCGITRSPHCVFCQGLHYNDQCTNFRTINERKQRIKDTSLCYRCLRSGHMAKSCRFNRPCIHCNGNHNRALCNQRTETEDLSMPIPILREEVETSQNVTEAHTIQTNQPAVDTYGIKKLGKEEPTEVNNAFVPRISEEVALMVTGIKVMNLENQMEEPISTYVLFDCGSQRSYLSQELAEKLKLNAQSTEILTVHTFASKNPQQIKTSIVNFGVQLSNGLIKPIYANVVPVLTEKLKLTKIKSSDLIAIKGLVDIKFEDCEEPKKPHILIGLDFFWDFFEDCQRIKLPSGLHLVESKIGYIVSGKQSNLCETNFMQTMVSTIFLETDETQGEQKIPMECENLEAFWNIETLGIKDSPMINDDEVALKKFNDTVTFEEGRYQVTWPWKDGLIELNENYGLAYGRLKSLLNRLKDHPKLLDNYNKIIEDQEQKGIIEKVDVSSKNENRKHYLPHHAIITPQKDTTKVRIVFDASAKMKKSAKSLNDCLYRGPILMPDLCGLLLRFRLDPIVIISDIEKAFLQIGIKDTERDVTRFLWLRDIKKLELEDNIQVYRFCRVTFGVISSPFLLSATLRYHLNQSGSVEMQKMTSNLYVDNLMVGVRSVEEASKMYVEAKSYFKKANFNLREWASNSKDFIQNLPAEDVTKHSEVKVLGILWDTKSDVLKLQINVKAMEQDGGKESSLTKRMVLQQLAATFDPLGLLCPLLLSGKVLLQKLWQEKLTWDEKLPEEFVKEWSQICSDLRSNREFFIPRMVPHTTTGVSYELLVFTDASKVAYSTAVYLKTTDENNISTVQLVFAKNKLAPMKEISLPRLELMAVLIGTRAQKFVMEQLKIPIKMKTLFTDSECVLHWLQSNKPLSLFVSNRVNEIKASQDLNFRYVSTKDNPADIATRPCVVSEFEECHLWWNGPNWIIQKTENWPSGNVPEISSQVTEYLNLEENLPIKTTCQLAEVNNILINLGRFSDLKKALRTIVYIFRFLKIKIANNVINENQNQDMIQKLVPIFANFKTTGPIEAEEIQRAEMFLIKQVQRECYPEFFDSIQQQTKKKENSLGIKLDQDGILRCYGRLQNAEIKQTAKFPVILPKNHRLTELIILEKHRKMMHFGISQTLAEIRQEFWIPKGRSVVKRVLSKCIICQKFNSGPFPLPKMSALPRERVMQAKPFEHVGLDYLGPLNIKQGGTNVKAWVCLFTCLSTRAVHLEYVKDQQAKTFLNCIKRFIARRGKPKRIVSDNAAQFKLVNKVLDEGWSDILNDEEVISYFANEKIQWKFIVELAPWQGGVYERLVGLTKQAMKKAIGRKILDLEEFLTLISEVEAVMNSRPLTYVGEECGQHHILRPIDFLIPFGSIGIPTVNNQIENQEATGISNSREKLLHYWKSTQDVLDKFWEIWYNDYLLSLREKHHLVHKNPRVQAKFHPKVGQIVQVKNEDLQRGSWKLGKIVGLNQGTDGEIRSVRIQLPNGYMINRPVNLLFPLEINTQDNEPTEQEPEVQSDDEPTTSNMNIIVQGLKKILSKTTVIMIILLTCCGNVLVANAEERRLMNGNHQCHNKIDSRRLIHSESCITTGISIWATGMGHLCWIHHECLIGQLLFNASCQRPRNLPECSCPDWSEGCSSYQGGSPEMNGDVQQILNYSKPDICSFSPSLACDPFPIHTTMPQIQLYDNSIHFIKTLQLVYQTPSKDEFLCVGEGPQIGTTEFCQDHKCENYGTKLCYYKHQEVVSFINKIGSIPIKAWGSLITTYYDQKKNHTRKQDCSTCQLKCIKGGIQVQTDIKNGTIELCAKPHCYHFIISNTTEVMFPKDTVLHNHEFDVKVWHQGFLIKEMGIKCPASPFCEMLNCYMCFDLILNPQCAPFAYLFLIFVIVYFVAGGIYFISRILRNFSRFLYSVCNCIFKLTTCARQLFQRRAKATGEELQSLTDSSDEEDELPKSGSKFGYNPSTKRQLLLTIVCSTIINYSMACSEVTTLTASKSICSIEQDQTMVCTLSKVTRISLTPKGQTVCLFIKGPESEPLGTISMNVEKIRLACQHHSEYFTRSFHMKVQSAKRCGGFGSCYSDQCEKIQTSSKVEELKGEPNNSPGFTYCADSCGCWACGCGTCTSACLFYRTFAKPLSDIVYEVFSCPTWFYEVEVRISINQKDREITDRIILKPGTQSTWNNLEFSLPSISTPAIPILGSQFLTDGKRTIMIRASASGQPVSGTVGQMQCQNKKKAKNFDCHLSHNICNCQARDTAAACSCSDLPLEQLFEKIDYALPLYSHGIAIKGNGKRIKAEFNDISILELQLSMKNFQLVTKVENNQCEIISVSFTGCYSCITGAKLDYECKTTFGEALAHVTCGQVSFSTICTADGFKSNVKLHFHKSIVRQECNVLCPGGNSSFIIEGTLIYIQKEMLTNLSDLLSIAQSISSGASEIDFSPISAFFSNNWIKTLLTILGAVILVILSVIFLPTILQMLLFIINAVRNYLTNYRRAKQL